MKNKFINTYTSLLVTEIVERKLTSKQAAQLVAKAWTNIKNFSDYDYNQFILELISKMDQAAKL